jgi:hypothetical protein
MRTKTDAIIPAIAIPMPLRTPVARHDTAPTIDNIRATNAVILPKPANIPAPRIATAIMIKRNATILRMRPVVALTDLGFC